MTSMTSDNILSRFAFVFALIVLSSWVHADEIRPAYLELTQTTDDRFNVFWKVPARGNNERLALKVKFDDKTRQEVEPMGGFQGGAHEQYWAIKRLGGLTGSVITIEGLPQTSTEVLLRIAYLDDASIVHRLTPQAPAYTVSKKPSWMQIAATYFVLGVEHILFGFDHLLFVFVLVLLVQSKRKLIATITAFTVAHSITLILAALAVIRIPVPPVEASIALSIAFVATEIIRGQQGQPGLTARYPWLIAFIFGLLHGLGFAAALGQIGLPQNAIATALVVFNVGVEVGQLLFVFSVLCVWWLIKRLSFSIPQWVERIPPYVVGSLATFWTIERVAAFWG